MSHAPTPSDVEEFEDDEWILVDSRPSSAQVTANVSPPRTSQSPSTTTDAISSQMARKPVFNISIPRPGSLAIYSYTVPEGTPFRSPAEGGDWPVIVLTGVNRRRDMEQTVVGRSEWFRRELAIVLYGRDGQKSVTVEELGQYTLVLADATQEEVAKMWVDEALGSIKSDPVMVTKREGLTLSPVHIKNVQDTTGVVPWVWRRMPDAAGYMLDHQGRFESFIIVGGKD